MPKKMEGETTELRLTIPKTLAGYLALLARDSLLGASSNDIAARLLINEADRLYREGEHLRKVLTWEPTEGG